MIFKIIVNCMYLIKISYIAPLVIKALTSSLAKVYNSYLLGDFLGVA